MVHDTPDNMPKQAKRKVKTPQGMKYQRGDTARGSLHKDTHYGAIERNGEIVYVVRKSLSSFEKVKDLDNIVDETVKAKVKKAVAEKGFKQAIASDIYMNEEKKILIKKVRCFAKIKNPIDIRHHRDVSEKEYKRQCHVQNDGNYCIAIYERIANGKVKRTFEVVDMIKAASHFRKSSTCKHIHPIVNCEKNNLPYRYSLITGTMVILLQYGGEIVNLKDNISICKRLYHVTGIEKDGRITLIHNQEARESETLKKKPGAFNAVDGYCPKRRISISDFHALVEGVDFEINAIGEIRLKVSIC